MRIRVRLFAIQRELVGTREVPLDLAEEASVNDAWTALVARYPALAPGRPFVRFARNAEYADPGTPLADGELDVAALLAECRVRMPAYMVPAGIEVRNGPLPRNPNGKIDRKTLSTEWVEKNAA